MTTITVNGRLNFPKLSFDSEGDFFETFAELFFTKHLDFRELKHSELTPELVEKKNKVHAKNMSEFIRI